MTYFMKDQLSKTDILEALLFAAEAPLLRGPALREIPEDGVDRILFYTLNVPTSVEIPRQLLGGNEAAVQVNEAATGLPQEVARNSKSREQLPPPRIERETTFELFP